MQDMKKRDFLKTYGQKKTKYGAHKTVVDGIKFDSRKEAERYYQLKFLEKQGTIKDLQRQVKFVLIPTQRDKDGKLLERERSYIADFVYIMHGERIVEDTKGFRTAEYKLKKALMLYIHGILIHET